MLYCALDVVIVSKGKPSVRKYKADGPKTYLALIGRGDAPVLRVGLFTNGLGLAAFGRLGLPIRARL